MNSFNPIFVAYSRANGNSPEEQLEKDAQKYPGGKMCGFILWVAQKKREFFRFSPDSFLDKDTIGDLEAWNCFVTKETSTNP